MGTQRIVRRWNYPNMLRSIVHEFGHALVGETLGFRINSMRFKYVLPDISLRPRPTLCDVGGTTELADIRDLDGKPRADKSSELMAVAAAGIVAEDVALSAYRDDILAIFRGKDRYAGDRQWIHEIANGPFNEEHFNEGVDRARSILLESISSLLDFAKIIEHHIEYYRFRLPHQLPDEQIERLRALVVAH